ncbi:hypothetical protein NLM24_21220 [Nocardia zapadnayensis]|uniref:hypothetical protein n=1 Tax=Nocardia rhamnosiphila TaxID=426716 RepID=UPI0022483EF8|nr:hypothetical protein [Nocardia zapadnayensis]MCX0273177.1 hypothetical protein [Nocardia zapadnayensis]
MTMDDPQIAVDPDGFAAAMEALVMDDPHPNGSVEDSPSLWLRRALYAYEWAKQTCRAADERSEVREIGPGRARAAVLCHEAHQYDQQAVR